uniref:Uncharacterized protein n=1 Tax=Clytia hemisphaerica TaxID=252671 RepID=A0A7M5UQS2_9CNID
MKLEIDSMKGLLDLLIQYDASTGDVGTGDVEFELSVSFHLKQKPFEKLMASNIGQNLVKLICCPESEEELSCIDFSKVKLPKLKEIRIEHQGVMAVHFTKENTPLLESLIIELPSHNSFKYFILDLPNLTYLGFEHVSLYDPDDFGKSLSSCPKLKKIECYKFYGLHFNEKNTPKLVLPSCEVIDLHRSDGLQNLDIWAPKLQFISFQACFEITKVCILDTKPEEYSGPDYDFKGEPSKYKVNLSCTSKPIGNLVSSTRYDGRYPEDIDHQLDEEEEVLTHDEINQQLDILMGLREA